jgi:inner membrane protein
MEPVTHILTGALLARAGLNRRAAYATLAMAIAAELPDIDVLWSFAGPIPSLQHHRGITHTFLGIPVEAALVTAAFYAFHRLRPRATRATANWPMLFLATLVALLSHLFLDWTNNYGLRPFFPFDPHWYAGSFVFIFEPVLFLLLLIGLVTPSLFTLINSEIGATRPTFRGQGWAITALLGMSALWGFRFLEHQKILQLVAVDAAADPAYQPARLSASPYPINPFRWHVVIDTPNLVHMYTVDTESQGDLIDEEKIIKPAPTVATLIAKRSPLGEVYLDWSQYPLVDQVAPSTPDSPLTPVTFRDARFLYQTFLLDGRHKAPLGGTVFVNLNADQAHRIAEMELNGRIQK